ncbi:hypothetical protein SeJ_A2632 [Salmonella enterica subsp. enterica serovar Javiana str. GA_MM04042433]|nr:hypothetical protein SeJ_A2632 [Salmonella enterica subsp. enterica serovar Javiana str. GA_MM04042433]
MPVFYALKREVAGCGAAFKSDRIHEFIFLCNSSKKVNRTQCMLRAFN